MTSLKLGRADYLELGDYNAICYRCGCKRKAAEMKKQWQGYWVCPEHWEPRQPQDFVRAVPDNMTVPWAQPQLNFSFVAGPGITSNYTTVFADANSNLTHPSSDPTARTWTIANTSQVPYTLGTFINIQNLQGAGSILIKLSFSQSNLKWITGEFPIGGTGNRILATGGTARLVKIGPTTWEIYGAGLT